MESWEAIAISQALRLGQFWHACNMPLTAHRHVNGKPLKIGINWRKFVPFHPLDLQKTENKAVFLIHKAPWIQGRGRMARRLFARTRHRKKLDSMFHYSIASRDVEPKLKFKVLPVK